MGFLLRVGQGKGEAVKRWSGNGGPGSGRSGLLSSRAFYRELTPSCGSSIWSNYYLQFKFCLFYYLRIPVILASLRSLSATVCSGPSCAPGTLRWPSDRLYVRTRFLVAHPPIYPPHRKWHLYFSFIFIQVIHQWPQCPLSPKFISN